jgi:hypothetical protein
MSNGEWGRTYVGDRAVLKDARCIKCAFWVPSDDSKIDGECHRHAPTGGFDGFPQTLGESWCAEHVDKPSEADDGEW